MKTRNLLDLICKGKRRKKGVMAARSVGLVILIAAAAGAGVTAIVLAKRAMISK